MDTLNLYLGSDIDDICIEYLYTTRVLRYPNGGILSVSTYLDGKRHGKFESRYRNGRRKLLLSFENGVRHGKWIEWFSDGTMYSCGIYINGKKFKYYRE